MSASDIEIGLSTFVIVAYGLLFWILVVRRSALSRLTFVRSRRRRQETGTSFLYWFSPILFIAVWGVASYTGLASDTAIPAPSRVLLAFWELMKSGILLSEALISLRRILVGFFLASLIGVPLGLLAGTFLVGRQLIGPINSFLRYIPPTAFIVLLIVYFGVDEAFKYAVVLLGVIFFIIQMTIDTVEDLDARYVEMALTSGSTNWDVFRYVVLPFCWPRVFDVLRINLSAAWTFLVAAELIGAERGLGHFIATSQRFLRLEDVYAGILTFGIIGLLTDSALESISHRLFRWYYLSLAR